MMHLRWLLLALVLAGLGACDGNGGAAASQTPAPPPRAAKQEDSAPIRGRWVEVERKTLRKFSSAVGSFQARRTTRIGPQISGRVEEVLVGVGDSVTKGQELVRLESSLLTLEIAQRKADVDAAQVAVDEAALQYARMKKLWEKPEGQEPSVPRKLYDDAKAKVDGAVARLAQARSALLWIEERFKETHIRAPYDAVVTRRLVDPGEPVTQAPVSSLLEIQEVGRLDLDFSLPQELLGSVKAGTGIEFEVEGVPGKRRTGAVAVVFPALDESTRSFKCRVQVENADGAYRPGLLARVYVLQNEAKDCIVVPRKALSPAGAAWQIVVSKEGRSTPVPVERGLLTDDEAEIRSGIEPGAKVLVPE
jgi:membrane fusion protein (multidrug efflux system)